MLKADAETLQINAEAAVHVEGMKDFAGLQQYNERASPLGTSLVKLVLVREN